MVRVMIADDNADWITSCSTILTKEKDIALCGIAMDGEEAYNSYLINKPDVGYGIYIEWMLQDAGVIK